MTARDQPMPPPTPAARELATVEVRGMTRGAFLMRGALAAAAASGGALVGPLVSRALAQDGDLAILQFALTLEHLEADFYERALKQARGLGTEVRELAHKLGEHELEHVDSLTIAIRKLGGEPEAKPEVSFGRAFANEDAFLRTAGQLEQVGVAAYNGAAPAIRNEKLFAAAASIVQVEARHLALVNLSRGADIAPDGAFTRPLDERAVRRAIRPFVGA